MQKEAISLITTNNSEPVIDTDSLTYYLLGAQFLWKGNQRFARHLNLGFYTPKLLGFYNDVHLVNIQTDQQRTLLLSHDFGDTTSGTKFAEARRRIKEETERFANLQGEREDSVNFYYDFSDNQIKSIRSEPGDHTSTPAAIFKVLKMDDCQPLIEAHRHPEDSFFSPQDFHPLLTEQWRNGPSLSNAVLILCPNIQVLALASKLTPVLPQKEAMDLFGSINSNPMEGNELEHEKNLKRIGRLTERRGKFVVESNRRYFAEAAPLEEEMKRKGAKEEEIMQVLKQIADKYQSKTSKYLDRNAATYRKALQQMMELLHRTIESNFVDFARSINVVLYNSNDFKHFYLFSA